MVSGNRQCSLFYLLFSSAFVHRLSTKKLLRKKLKTIRQQVKRRPVFPVNDSISHCNITTITPWKVSVFGLFLVRIFPHLCWIRKGDSYSAPVRGNSDQKNSKCWHFSSSVFQVLSVQRYLILKSSFYGTHTNLFFFKFFFLFLNSKISKYMVQSTENFYLVLLKF